MQRCRLAVVTVCTLVFASLAMAQTPPPSSGTKNAINGINSYPGPEFIKYSADEGAPRPAHQFLHRRLARIDAPFRAWLVGAARHSHSRRQFCSSGKGRGSLRAANFFAYGRLAAGAWTVPSKLDHHQEIYYILGGTGEITAGGDTAKLQKNIAVLMPAGLEFVMRSIGDEPLTMYVINEPTPENFHPKDKMVIKDEAAARQRTPAGGDPYIVGGASGHWAHIVKEIFSPADGLATEQSVITVTVNPLTMGEPHPTARTRRSVGSRRRHQSHDAGNGTAYPETGNGLHAATGFDYYPLQYQRQRPAGEVSLFRAIPRRGQLHSCRRSRA